MIIRRFKGGWDGICNVGVGLVEKSGEGIFENSRNPGLYNYRRYAII